MEYSHTLRYTDEADKSLGIAGMSIALLACDGEDCIMGVSIEDGENALEFAPSAFCVSNPRFSAKIAWTQLTREFHMVAGMFLGNVICRRIVTSRSLNSDIINALREIVYEQGREKCDFDDDELDTMFDSDIRYFHRLFSHPTVAETARNFASALRTQRRMTAGDVLDYLSRLSAF